MCEQKLEGLVDREAGYRAAKTDTEEQEKNLALVKK